MANIECKQVADILPPRTWHRMKCRRSTQSRELPNMETKDYNLIGISAGPGSVVCSESRRLERKIEINSDTRRHASVTSRGQHSYKEWSMRACSDSLLGIVGQSRALREVLLVGGPQGAAVRLGINCTTLIHRMRKLGVFRQ